MKSIQHNMVHIFIFASMLKVIVEGIDLIHEGKDAFSGWTLVVIAIGVLTVEIVRIEKKVQKRNENSIPDLEE